MPRARPATPRLETRGGVYYATWYNPTKRQREGLSLRTRIADEATPRFAAFLLQGSDLYKRKAGLHGLTVEEALDTYYADHCQKKCADPVRQRIAMDNLKRHFGGTAIKLIDDTMVALYVDRRSSGLISGNGRAAAPSTIRRELVVLVAAINRARKKKKLPLADVPSIDLPEAPPAKETWLTHEQLAALRAELVSQVTQMADYVVYCQDACDRAKANRLAAEDVETAENRIENAKEQLEVARQLRDFTEIAYYTAGRRRSVEGLTLFQVDLKQDRIRLAKPGERKTKKRRPVVRIDPELRPTVERLVARAKERGGTDTEVANRHILGSPRSLYKPFVKACERAGIPDVSPHILRHTRATHLLQAGVSIWDVAKLLGDTVATVDRVYGHAAAEYQGAVVERKGEQA